MNCDVCIEGYYLRVDDINIRNCFSNDIKVPQNYYNIENEPNIYYKCYKPCGSCFKEGNYTNMNCLTCIDNDVYEYDSYYKNCFFRKSCVNSYYYIYDENKQMIKICIYEGEKCPENLPFINTVTNECIMNCSYENIINNICKISSFNVNIEKIVSNFQREIQNNNQLHNK